MNAPVAIAKTKTRVVVAMSGGVDSSVTAALMTEAGHDVVGVTLQLYDHGAAVKKKGACCAGDDIHDARRVAEHLGIAHYVLDYEERFRRDVMEDFAASYARGETPIPCVRCNETVKFRDLLTMARELGADQLATGHYVRRVEGANGAELHRAADPSRDQSYFLFSMTREQLDFVRFPLGDLPKSETRGIASRLGLSVADKADSQDICFVPQGRYSDVVAKLKPGAIEPGEIVHLDGRVLGRHEGVIHFTVGQRKGLGIAVGDPLFVIRLDAPNRRVIVGPREALETKSIVLRDLNWLGDVPLSAAPIEVMVRVRSTREPVAGTVRLTEDRRAEVTLATREESVAPGQACVFYEPNGSRVLGGGWIVRGDSGLSA